MVPAREPDWSEYSEYDDTLVDARTPKPTDRLAASWLADQRFMHGLMRAAHSADAPSHRARIDAILHMVEREPQRRQRWGAVAAVATLLLCAIAWPVFFVAGLPEAEASVLRGAELLGRDVDRHFVVESSGGKQLHQEFELIARPGNRFLVSGSLVLGPIQFLDMRFGCDGTEFWFHSTGSENGLSEVRRAGPLDEAPSLLRGIGNVLDLGLLNLQSVVQQLPRDFRLRTKAIETAGDGRNLVHVEATGRPQLPGSTRPGSTRPGFHLHRADVWCDEATGMIVRLEVEADDGFGRLQRFLFDYQGSVAVDAEIYERPW